MRISLGTVEVTDIDRKAINHYYGDSGMATRDEVRHFMLTGADDRVQSAIDEYYEEQK